MFFYFHAFIQTARRHKNTKFFTEKCLEIREKEKKVPEVMMSRRCAKALNQIGQKEGSENGI